MIKFILFIKKIHFVLIFVILEILAINYYANSTSYTKAKLVTASNHIVGGIHSKLSGVGHYMHLSKENDRLIRELAELHNKYDRFDQIESESQFALTQGDSVFLYDDKGIRSREYYHAKVVNNSIMRQENYITINKGVSDGIQPDMALVSGNSIVGYVLGCSDRFSVCMSILNQDFRTGGRIKGSDYFGTVFWDGLSYEYVTLSEVPKYAEINVGDTIVTSSYSLRFPPDLLIGIVESYQLNNATFYDIKVKLSATVAALNNVLAVKNMDYGEINSLEQSVLNPVNY